ncbi:MAG TPA: hypothetical protein VKN18_28885 [Blastocatellia bacterium]|nr:hypothetical protein [Blastocatellia bacterium]
MIPDEELNALKERLSQMSDRELLKIVEEEYGDYRHEAIEFAEQELTKRNVPFESPELVEEEEEDGEVDVRPGLSQSNVYCGNCGGKMRAGLLFADKELTVLFQDNKEERFLQVLACTSCGDVRLTVDLFTDVEG